MSRGEDDRGQAPCCSPSIAGPPLVEGPERGTGDENIDVDEHLALMPLQQVMREAGMRRDLQVPRLTGQLQLQLGQQIGGGLLELLNQIAQRLGVSGTARVLGAI